ncbi:MAG: rhodanese-like domain-containing protein [Eubacteriales bacterium]
MFAFLKNNQFTSINVNSLEKGKTTLIDIREPNEYTRGSVPGAKNIPMLQLLSTPKKHLNESKQYHIICQTGGRSLRACKVLSSLGYNVVNVSGGTNAYKRILKK